MKTCNKCNKEKDISFFPKSGAVCKKCKYEYHKEYTKQNKEKIKEYLTEYSKSYRLENKDIIKEKNIKYREENKDIIKERNIKYCEENKDKIKERHKKYREENKEVIKQRNDKWKSENKNYFNDYIKERCLIDNKFKLTSRIRALVRNSIKFSGHTKRSNTSKIIGCSFEEFKYYLESKFEEWMNWENYGKYNGELNYGWDIDHIIPLSSAETEEDIIRLNHFTNLQPLCSKLNRDIKRNHSY
jgi:hypothetical protein